MAFSSSIFSKSNSRRIFFSKSFYNSSISQVYMYFKKITVFRKDVRDKIEQPTAVSCFFQILLRNSCILHQYQSSHLYSQIYNQPFSLQNITLLRKIRKIKSSINEKNTICLLFYICFNNRTNLN